MTIPPTAASWTRTGGAHAESEHDDLVQLGVWMFLSTVVMLFAAFTSAYIVRRSALDWVPIDLPRMLWLNTGLLVASSLALEGGRRASCRGNAASARWGLRATIGLGILFLFGQLTVWRELVAQGVYLPTGPHSAFVYILSGIHGVHVVAGLLLLTFALAKIGAVAKDNKAGKRMSVHTVSGPGATNRRAAVGLMTASATFWHFLAVLWVYVIVLVTVF
jgi:cytochrome c oxidase subunit 3